MSANFADIIIFTNFALSRELSEMSIRRVIAATVLMFVAALSISAQNMKDVDNSPSWIGAITKADAHIPEGRSFSGGKLKGDEKLLWDAVDSLSRRSIILNKVFDTGKGTVAKASVKICGLGFYELTINGRRVGDSEFAPAWSDYDKTVFYNVYDVTDLMLPLNNDICVLLGNGFYNEQGGRYAKMRVSFGPPTLYFDLCVTYSDGQQEHIVSDGTWRYRLSPVTFNSIYGGEDHDARLEDMGSASEVMPEAAVWRDVVIQESPKGVMREQIALPVKIMERYSIHKRLGTTTFDMGQNLSGYPEIRVRGRRGQKVRLYVGETLTPDTLVNQKQTGRPYYYTYTLRGGDSETWHPRFSYYGYQYIQIEGAVMEGDDNPLGLPVIEDLQSCFVYNSAPKTGYFECSNQLFNDTYRIIDRAIRSNWQAVWTDCPHREKLGWLEQDWLNGEGLIYNYDCRAMIEQTMRNIVDAQHADGSMPEIAPEYTVFKGSWAKPFLESPEWGGAIIALPVLYDSYYGSDKLCREYYEPMLRYVDYLHTQDSCYILNQGLGDWYDYGEGKAGFSKNTPVPLVATAHYYKWTLSMAFIAQQMDKREDEERLFARADSIQVAYIREFYNPETHSFGTGSQASNAISRVLRLVPDGDIAKVMDNIYADIAAHGNRLTTGDVGNRYLFEALSIHNPKLLYEMLNHHDVPGYGYQIQKGMTTLTEQWNPEHGASMNHFMMAHINNLLIPFFAGIQTGGGEVWIWPHPVGDLQWCKASTTAYSGEYSVHWQRNDDGLLMTVSIPDGDEAWVINPFTQSSEKYCAGTHKIILRKDEEK